MSEEEVIITPKQKLIAILEKIVPLADILSAKLLRFAIFVTLVSIWLAVFCYRLHSLPIVYTSIIAAISFIPAAIFYTYYFILQDIVELTKKTPNFHEEVKQTSKNLSDDLKKIKAIKREDINTLNLIATGKKIFDLITLVKSGKSILGQYVNVTFLVSPITFILLSSALFGLAILALIFPVTLIIAIV
jgi:hypothetical protein